MGDIARRGMCLRLSGRRGEREFVAAVQLFQAQNFIHEQRKIIIQRIPKNRFVDVEVAIHNAVTLANDLPGVWNGRYDLGKLHLDLAQGFAEMTNLKATVEKTVSTDANVSKPTPPTQREISSVARRMSSR